MTEPISLPGRHQEGKAPGTYLQQIERGVIETAIVRPAPQDARAIHRPLQEPARFKSRLGEFPFVDQGTIPQVQENTLAGQVLKFMEKTGGQPPTPAQQIELNNGATAQKLLDRLALTQQLPVLPVQGGLHREDNS